MSSDPITLSTSTFTHRGVTINIRVSTNFEDMRKLKRYGRNVQIGIVTRCPHCDPNVTQATKCNDTNCLAYLRLSDVKDIAKDKLTFGKFDDITYTGLRWQNYWSAAKPSEIPTAYACMDVNATVELVVDICKLALDRQFDREETNKRVQWANQIARHVVNKARKEAEAICRYDQRLAALQAELDEEFKVQVLKMGNDLVAAGVKMGDVTVAPEVVKVALTAAESRKLPHGFLDSFDRDMVSKADVAVGAAKND